MHQALGGLLVATLGLAFVLAGSTRPWALACIHGMLALAGLAAVSGSSRRLQSCARVVGMLSALSLLLVPLLISLVPLPMGVLEWLAPGVVAAREGTGWWALSLSPEKTIGAVFQWILVLGMVGVAGIWAADSQSRRLAERAVLWALLVYVVFAVAHLKSGASSILGLIPVQNPPDRFLAPLVNPNHVATPLLLAIPLVWGRTRDQLRAGDLRAGVAATALICAFMLGAATGSVGAPLALMATGILAWSWPPARKLLWTRLGMGVLAFAVCLVGLVFSGHVSEVWMEQSWYARLAEAAQYPNLLRQHPVAGVGGGAFLDAYAPFTQHEVSMGRTHHAHLGFMEWFLETGLVGATCLGLAIWRFPRLLSGRHPMRARRWTLGLVAMGLHGLIDFPFQITALLLLFFAALTIRWCAYPSLEAGSPSRLRRIMLFLVGLQVLGAAWQVHAATVERLASTAWSFQDEPQEARAAGHRLGAWAPWRVESTLVEMWAAEEDGRMEEAIASAQALRDKHPDQPNALRQAALTLLRQGRSPDAVEVLERAVTRSGSDYRNWLLLSHLAEERGDVVEAARALANATSHWPMERWRDAEPLYQGYELLPVGLWWLEALDGASGYWSGALAGILMKEGDAETALMAWDQASRLGPHWMVDRPEKARALVALGRVEEAEQYLEALIQSGGTHLVLWRELGLIQAADGREEQALLNLSQAVTMARNADEFSAWLLKELGEVADLELAILFAERLYARGVESPLVRLATARLYEQAGRFSDCYTVVSGLGALRDGEHGQGVRWLEDRCGVR